MNNLVTISTASDEAALEYAEEFVNSLSSLASSLSPSPYGSPQLSQSDTLFYNLRWYLISNMRQLLSELFVEHGIVQTLIDQPVDDAFRSGFEIKSSNLSADDIEQLLIYEKRNGVIRALMQARKWARLYGGGAVLLVTDQDPVTPLDIKKIKPSTPLEFRAVDMWELYFAQQNTTGTMEVGGALCENKGEFYDYYGKPVHKSRVLRCEGKQAPSFIRPRLRGWGMSELERLVRSLNQYLKNQDVIFELLDEAKVDVYKIKGFNNSLMTKDGTSKTASRVQLANQIKNFTNGLMMDAEDEYEQKQINFTGLNDMLLQIRQGIAADLKMPMTKLFGISAAGFNSGEDDIENYNSMLESEIRAPSEFQVVELLQISCQKLFGTTIPDLMITWNPLRILNAKEEEEVKDSQLNRVMSVYDRGLCDAQEAKESINAGSLLPQEIDAKSDALPAPGSADGGDVAGMGGGDAGKQTKEAKQAPKEA